MGLVRSTGRRFGIVGELVVYFAGHRRWWMLPFDNPDLDPELRRALGGEHGCAVAFSMNRNFYGPPWSPLPVEIRTALESNIPRLAGAAGVSVQGLSIDDDSIRLDFCVD